MRRLRRPVAFLSSAVRAMHPRTLDMLRSLVRGCLLVGLLGAAPALGEETISEEARRQFRAGVSLLEDPDGARYEEAYSAFRAAYAISPSPKILGNIGLCAMKLERDHEAIEAYSRYLNSARDIPEAERAQIERDLTTLRASLATVFLWVNPVRFTVLDRRTRNAGPAVINSYEGVGGGLALGLRPGLHELRIRAEGFEESVVVVSIAGGAQVSRTVELTPTQRPAPPPARVRAERPSLVPPIALASGGGVLLLAGTATGVIALSKTQQISDSCPRNQCPAGYDLAARRDDARRFVRATDALLLGGALVGLAGAAWLTVAFSQKNSPPQAARRVDGGAVCASSGCAGSLQVTFLAGAIMRSFHILLCLGALSGCYAVTDLERFNQEQAGAGAAGASGGGGGWRVPVTAGESGLDVAIDLASAPVDPAVTFAFP